MSPIRLMLVDDHEILRSGLRMMLQAETELEIVAEASSGAEAIAIVQGRCPDIVLMDVSMPDMDGIETTRQIKTACPEVKVLALTIHEEEGTFFKMLKAGASGYIPKRAASDDLLRAIRAVHRGETFIHSSVTGVLVKEYLQRESKPRPTPPSDEECVVSKREREVLILIAEGLTNKQIGVELGISPKTVARHRDNISKKLNLSTRAELARYAVEKGLLAGRDSGDR